MRNVGSSANGQVVGPLVEAHCDYIEWYIVSIYFLLCRVLMAGSKVLHTVYDKLANPSPDDPYEADIAAVRLECGPCSVSHRYSHLPIHTAPEDRQGKVPVHRERMDEEVSVDISQRHASGFLTGPCRHAT